MSPIGCVVAGAVLLAEEGATVLIQMTTNVVYTIRPNVTFPVGFDAVKCPARYI